MADRIVSRPRLRISWTLWFCLLLTLLTGCSSNGTVSGQITYQGKPVPSGTVLFMPEKGQAVTGIITDGHYQVKGIVKGMAKIAVQTPAVSTTSDMPSIPKGKIPKGLGIDSDIDPGAQSKDKTMPIPKRYQDPEKSGLTCTVKGGAQEHNIDLK